MNNKWIRDALYAVAAIAALGNVASSALAAPSKAAAATPCDRNCLIAAMDQYLAALVAHDASRVKVAKNFRATHDALPIKLGEGIWKTIGDINRRQYFADPVTGQVVLFALVPVGEDNAPFMVRLKIVNGEVAESESLLAAGAGQFVAPKMLPPLDPIFDELLPVREQSSRRTMATVPFQYADGMLKANGDSVPWDTTCNRLENWSQTANDVIRNVAPLSCLDSMNHYSYHFAAVPMRRVVVIDVERGVTVIIAQLERRPQPTNDPLYLAKMAARNAGRGLPSNTPIESDRLIGGEAFKIRNGKIRHIQATFIRQAVDGPDGGWGTEE